MLSQRSFITIPGPHQRQNSTPSKIDTPKHVSPVAHRRGVSSDQIGYNHRIHGFQHQDEDPTGVEYILGQQLTQTVPMRETQPQCMARPGHDQQIIYEQSDHDQLLRATPRLAHGTGALGNNHATTLTTDFDNQISQFREVYSFNTTDFSEFDRTTSAGNLDGFGDSIDEQTENVLPNEIMNEKPMPHGMTSTAKSRPTSKGLKLPCTPPAQMRTSTYKLWQLFTRMNS